MVVKMTPWDVFGLGQDQLIVDDASGYQENNKCDTIHTSKYLNDPIYTLLNLPRSQLGRNISLIHFFTHIHSFQGWLSVVNKITFMGI